MKDVVGKAGSEASRAASSQAGNITFERIGYSVRLLALNTKTRITREKYGVHSRGVTFGTIQSISGPHGNVSACSIVSD